MWLLLFFWILPFQRQGIIFQKNVILKILIFFYIFSKKLIKAPNWLKTNKYLQISKEWEIHIGICKKIFLNYKEKNVF